jgi:hypothetical protein
MSVTMMEVYVLGDCAPTETGVRAARIAIMTRLRLKTRALIAHSSFKNYTVLLERTQAP